LVTYSLKKVGVKRSIARVCYKAKQRVLGDVYSSLVENVKYRKNKRELVAKACEVDSVNVKKHVWWCLFKNK
jgi:hypothetical protein